jgi:hypothetical protein
MDFLVNNPPDGRRSVVLVASGIQRGSKAGHIGGVVQGL